MFDKVLKQYQIGNSPNNADVSNMKLDEFKIKPQISHVACSSSKGQQFVKLCQERFLSTIKRNHLQVIEDISQTSKFLNI